VVPHPERARLTGLGVGGNPRSHRSGLLAFDGCPEFEQESSARVFHPPIAGGTRRDSVLSTNVTSVTSLRCLGHVPMGGDSRIGMLTVNNLGLCLVVQLGLASGLAGLLWPDKFMPLFKILMFPWTASCRAIRANGIAAIGLSLILLVTRLAGYR
jgi:hypothetical protein